MFEPERGRHRWRRSDLESELDDELRFHLEKRREEYEEAGFPPDEARRRALHKFGDVSFIRAQTLTIDQRRTRRAARADLMAALSQDCRYALRTIRLTPAFSTIAAVTLALGIGATTVMFSVVDGVLLRPLPYAAADRLVSLTDVQGEGVETTVSYPEYLDWKARSQQALSEVAAWFQAQAPLTGTGDAQMLQGERISVNLPRVLGVTPLLGRSFAPDEELTSAPRVVMVSENLWRQRFAADPAIVGRVLTLAGQPATVIGVFPSSPRSRLPNELVSGRQTDYWMPLRLTEDNAPRGLHFLYVAGRLKPGIDVEHARGQLRSMAEQLRNDGVTIHDIRLTPVTARIVGSVGDELALLVASVLMLLLIACANVANLLLARAAARGREFGIRVALGASQGRMLSQLLTESVVRALLGGAMGVGVAYAGVWAMRSWLNVRLPRFEQVSIDVRVLAFATGLSVLVGLAFGVIPAWRATRGDPRMALSEGARGVLGGVGRDRFRRWLIMGEVALSFVLLVGAGLLLRSFELVLRVPLGFDPDRLMTAEVDLPPARYPDSTRQRAFFGKLLAGLESAPGVEGAGLTTSLPIQGGVNGGVEIEGKSFPADREPVAEKRVVSAGYLPMMKAGLIAGRMFDARDVQGAPPVVMVNEAFVRRWMPGELAVGKRVAFGWGTEGMQTIVGVVADLREGGLREDPAPAIYIPVMQRSSDWTYVVVRGALPPSSLRALVRQTVRAIDPDLAVSDVLTIDEIRALGVSTERLTASILATFAVVALVLAAVGLYGVISYSVAQRTQELGVRAALGARRSDLMRLVMRQGVGFLAGGLVFGGVAAFGLSRLMANQLFGIGPRDPGTFVGVGLVLAAVALGAIAVPALRATRSDPLSALRAE